jgi:hypothetical protein
VSDFQKFDKLENTKNGGVLEDEGRRGKGRRRIKNGLFIDIFEY